MEEALHACKGRSNLFSRRLLCVTCADLCLEFSQKTRAARRWREEGLDDGEQETKENCYSVTPNSPVFSSLRCFRKILRPIFSIPLLSSVRLLLPDITRSLLVPSFAPSSPCPPFPLPPNKVSCVSLSLSSVPCHFYLLFFLSFRLTACSFFVSFRSPPRSSSTRLSSATRRTLSLASLSCPWLRRSLHT